MQDDMNDLFAQANIIKKKKEKEEIKESNFLLGLIGALVGSLFGGIMWFLFCQHSTNPGMMGLITAAMIILGYELLGKTIDKKGLFACIFIVMITIFCANIIVWQINPPHTDMFYFFKDIFFQNNTPLKFFSSITNILPIASKSSMNFFCCHKYYRSFRASAILL